MSVILLSFLIVTFMFSVHVAQFIVLSLLFSSLVPSFFCVWRRGEGMLGGHSSVILGYVLGISKAYLWSLLQLFGHTRELLFVFRKKYRKTIPRGRLS